jgi:hypothetical protein
VSTHERELTAPVDLAEPAGRRVNREALGWSRHPLHRDNLAPCDGRNKRWDYWAILAGERLLSATIADLDQFVLGDVWWADLASGRTGGRGVLAPSGETSSFASYPVRLDHDDLTLHLGEEAERTTLEARWTEEDGSPGVLEGEIARPEGLESLNVVIPWDEELFNYTSKQWCRPVTGSLVCAAGSWTLGETERAWGVLDVGRGRWPARIEWNWGGGSGWSDGHLIGLQFGARWTEGSGFTENGLLVDGRLSKIGRELEWTYDWASPLAPWRVRDAGGQLDVALRPRYDKHTAVDASEDLGTEVHQVFGTWWGWMVDDEGHRIEVCGIEGFAEEARQRW